MCQRYTRGDVWRSARPANLVHIERSNKSALQKRNLKQTPGRTGNRLSASRLIAAVLSCRPSRWNLGAFPEQRASSFIFPRYADDSWMGDERLWQDYDKKPNPKNRLSPGGDTSSASADVRSIPVLFAKLRPPCLLPPSTRYSSITATSNKTVRDFLLSRLRASPLANQPAASPSNPNGIFSYRAAYQIQIQVMDKCAPAEAPERLLLLSINMFSEPLCPVGIYDIMRSIRRPTWATRPPITQSHFFFFRWTVSLSPLVCTSRCWQSGNNPFSPWGDFYVVFSSTYSVNACLRGPLMLAKPFWSAC